MSLKGVLLVVVALVLLSGRATATEHLVGDTDGWRPEFNYTKWAWGKEFRVGDTLVFKYTKDLHNVYNVTGAEFRNCTVPKRTVLGDSGADTILLRTEGKKWYICGKKDHCKRGQKLVIDVLPAPPAPPAPSPAPADSSAGVFRAVPRMALAAVAAIATINALLWGAEY